MVNYIQYISLYFKNNQTENSRNEKKGKLKKIYDIIKCISINIKSTFNFFFLPFSYF